jgi:hypothetical protein
MHLSSTSCCVLGVGAREHDFDSESPSVPSTPLRTPSPLPSAGSSGNLLASASHLLGTKFIEAIDRELVKVVTFFEQRATDVSTQFHTVEDSLAVCQQLSLCPSLDLDLGLGLGLSLSQQSST